MFECITVDKNILTLVEMDSQMGPGNEEQLQCQIAFTVKLNIPKFVLAVLKKIGLKTLQTKLHGAKL